MQKNSLERRKFQRVPFSKDDGLLGLLGKPTANSFAITTSILDISNEGIRFYYNTNGTDISIGDRLILREIAGAANLTFQEPIELCVIWVKKNQVVPKSVWVGCKIESASESAKNQLNQFIQSEIKWKNSMHQGSHFGGNKYAHPHSTTDTHLNPPNPLNTDHNKRFISPKLSVIGAILAILILLGIPFIYLKSIKATFSKRVSEIETKIEKTLQNQETSIETLQAQLASIETKVELWQARIRSRKEKADATPKPVETIKQAPSQTIAPVSPPTHTAIIPLTKDKAPRVPDTKRFHLVQRGDNLYRIALKYHTSVTKLVQLNQLNSSQNIRLGQRIKLP